jgi:hypothetical protein
MPKQAWYELGRLSAPLGFSEVESNGFLVEKL